MPQINQGKSGGVIVFDENDFSQFAPQGGLTTTVVKSAPGYSYATNIDPYRRVGYVSPGLLPTSATNNSQMSGTYGVAFCQNTSSYGYVLTNSGKILELNYSSNTLTSSSDYPHTIAHGAHTGYSGSDVVIYQHNLGGAVTRSAFFSYNDGTDFNVGRIGTVVASPSFTDDFMSTVPASPLAGSDLTYGKDFPHPLCVGADDKLYIGSGRYLHAYDGGTGTNGTFIAKVLTLPQGFIITSICKSPNFLLIGGIYALGNTPLSAQNTNEALVYTWNYTDLDVTSAIPCEDGWLSKVLMYRGTPMAVTSGAFLNRGSIRVKALIGDSFKTVAELPTTSIPLNGGVDVVSNQMFLNCGGTVFTVGSPFDEGYQVNQIGTLNGTTDSGFIKNIIGGSSRLVIGSSTGVVDKFNGSFATAQLVTSLAEPIFAPQQIGKITCVEVIYKGTVTSGREFSLDVYSNNGATITTVINGEATLSAPTYKRYLNDYQGIAFPQFKDLSLLLSWQNGASTGAAQISNILVYYDNINI